ncbi:uroporphyrinogen-III synthase [Zeimonas arvi]|uniref:uroporphyrinogen-III synthase n=1 Tax=Zeimonas arvi TaxID=2498847 RepID=UPI00164F7B7B|nr:uroporphyrinogen-III synthase [Zeimonas arvi]
MARLVLTLPEPRAASLARVLVERGHEALRFAFVALHPLTGLPGAAALMAALARFDRVVFVSPTAIEVFADALHDGWPSGLAPAVVGPGSLAVLADRGGDRHPGLLVPPGPAYDAEALLALPALAAPLHGRILVVRAEGGNPRIERELAARGARTEVFEAYRRTALQPDRGGIDLLARWLSERETSCVRVLVTTVEAAERLAELAGGPGALGSLRDIDALAIHPRIADRLRTLGWKSVTPIEPGLEALLAAIESDRRVAEAPGQRQHRSGSDSD